MKPILEEAREFGIHDGRRSKEELLKTWFEHTMELEEKGVGLIAQAGVRFRVALNSNTEVTRCRSSW